MIKSFDEALRELATTIWLEYNSDARMAMEIVAFIYDKPLTEVQDKIQKILNQSG